MSKCVKIRQSGIDYVLKLQVSAYDVRESEDIHFRYKRNIAYGYIGKDAESGNQIL